MKVLVTGGAGFIGSHIVEACLEVGHEVYIVDNLSTGRIENLASEATFHQIDIGTDEFNSLFSTLKPDTVIHMAAQINVTSSVSDPIYDAKSNILNTIQLLDLCVKFGTKRIIFASSAAVYGITPANPVDETIDCNPLSPYGVSKLSCEEYIKYYARSYPISYTIFRNGNVYGPRQIAQGECGVCSVFTDQMLANKTPTLYGNGTPQRDYVYVGDVAQANVLALESTDNQTVNISSGKGTPTSEVFEHIAQLLDFKEDPHLAPLRAGEIENIYLSNTKAFETIRWTPSTSLADGLMETIKYCRKISCIP